MALFAFLVIPVALGLLVLLLVAERPPFAEPVLLAVAGGLFLAFFITLAGIGSLQLTGSLIFIGCIVVGYFVGRRTRSMATAT